MFSFFTVQLMDGFIPFLALSSGLKMYPVSKKVLTDALTVQITPLAVLRFVCAAYITRASAFIATTGAETHFCVPTVLWMVPDWSGTIHLAKLTSSSILSEFRSIEVSSSKISISSNLNSHSNYSISFFLFGE